MNLTSVINGVGEAIRWQQSCLDLFRTAEISFSERTVIVSRFAKGGESSDSVWEVCVSIFPSVIEHFRDWLSIFCRLSRPVL